MKKITNKITSVFLLLALPVVAMPTFRQLLLPSPAQAQTTNAPMFFQQPTGNGTIISTVGIGGGYWWNGTMASGSNGIFQYFGSALPVPPVSDLVTQLDLQLKDVYGGNTSHPDDTIYVWLYCQDGSHHQSSNTITYGNLTSAYGTFGFFFDPGSTCDLSTNPPTKFGILSSSTYGGGHYYTGTSTLYQGYLGTNSNQINGLSLGTGATAANYSLWFNLHDQNHIGIYFQNPPYYSGMKTTDFNNWVPCVYLANDHTNTSHYIDISYRHTATTTPEYLDSQFVQIGTIRDPLGQVVNECEIMTKTRSLDPGDYTAVAQLYDQDSMMIFQSAPLTFTITTGTSVDYPNQQNPNAPPTTVSCNQNNVVVQGICQILAYLFVPPNDSLNQFQGLWDGIKTKPPFGYFVAVQTALSGLAIGSPVTSMQGISLLSIFFSPIKIGFTLLIFFLAGMYIFNRLRHFNF